MNNIGPPVQPAVPNQPNTIQVDGDQNLKEALGFVKDWVTSLIGIETAAIGAIGAFFEFKAEKHLSVPDAVLLDGAMISFLVSIICGAYVLNMLPGCAQRTQTDKSQDIYSLKTKGAKTLGWWAIRFRYAFLVGLILFVTFIIVRTLPTRSYQVSAASTAQLEAYTPPAEMGDKSRPYRPGNKNRNQ